MPRPTRLTKLPSRIGLCSLAAVAKLHERVQGAWGHGQVDGVAEGGAVRGKNGKSTETSGVRAWPELSDTPSPPDGPQGTAQPVPKALQRKGAPGGEEEACG